jgi:serine/threonine protein kinase
MSPEQVQSAEITPRSDIYSLGAVMYELLTGFRPFRANSLSKLLHQIVYATPPPIHTLREEIPEELEAVVVTALQKDPSNRYTNGLEFAGALTRLYQTLRNQYDRIDQQEQFDLLRRLRFFHDFSHSEIWELLRASEWCAYEDGEEIIREGELDDRFYIIVHGTVSVQSGRRQIGVLSDGDCFGETGYVRGARRTATISAVGDATLVRVSSTLLEQASSACQLRFNKVFLRSLIERLQGVAASGGMAPAT